MKRFKFFALTSALALAAIFGSATLASAQEVTMKSIGKKVASSTKTGVKRGLRVGHVVGNRVWTGSKWVARKSWRGGTWVAVKTARGTKWVYRKGRNFVVGKPARRP